MENIQEKVKKVLKEKDCVLFAYLFGSQATGHSNEKSDVDVAVYIDENCKEKLFDIRLKLMEDITRATKKEVDVVILNQAKPFLSFVVIKEGETLINRDPEKELDFYLKTFNEYQDYKIFMKTHYGEN